MLKLIRIEKKLFKTFINISIISTKIQKLVNKNTNFEYLNNKKGCILQNRENALL